MRPAHTISLARARGSLAALADRASSIDASSAYERALIELDRIHGDECPTSDNTALPTGHEDLFVAATTTIKTLECYAVDPLGVELVLAMLDDAHSLDDTDRGGVGGVAVVDGV